MHRFVPFTRHSGTDGTDTMIKTFHQLGGRMNPLVPLMKVGTSVLTIATAAVPDAKAPSPCLAQAVAPGWPIVCSFRPRSGVSCCWQVPQAGLERFSGLRWEGRLLPWRSFTARTLKPKRFCRPSFRWWPIPCSRWFLEPNRFSVFPNFLFPIRANCSCTWCLEGSVL